MPVLCAILAVLVIAACVVLYYGSDMREEKKKKKLAKIAELERIRDLKQKYKCKKSNSFEHLYGLNIPQGAMCDVWICSKRLVMYYGTPIILSYGKIIKVEMLDQTQFKKHYVDNTTGAIAGGMAFGTIGALLGGGTKAITDVDKKYILSITYDSDNSIKYILFDVTSNKYVAKEFVDDINFRKMKILEKRNQKEQIL